MRGAEVKAVGELAGQALSGTGALVRDLHLLNHPAVYQQIRAWLAR